MSLDPDNLIVLQCKLTLEGPSIKTRVFPRHQFSLTSALDLVKEDYRDLLLEVYHCESHDPKAEFVLLYKNPQQRLKK